MLAGAGRRRNDLVLHVDAWLDSSRHRRDARPPLIDDHLFLGSLVFVVSANDSADSECERVEVGALAAASIADG